jgi:hypothetical protein
VIVGYRIELRACLGAECRDIIGPQPAGTGRYTCDDRARRVETRAAEMLQPPFGLPPDEAREGLEKISGVNVAPQVQTGPLDALAAKAREVLSLLQQIPGAVSASNGALNNVRARSSSASFSDGVTPGAGP